MRNLLCVITANSVKPFVCHFTCDLALQDVVIRNFILSALIGLINAFASFLADCLTLVHLVGGFDVFNQTFRVTYSIC